MYKLQNLDGFFLDDKGKLYKWHPEKGYIPKKPTLMGTTLGYRIKHNFISLKILKSKILAADTPTDYKLPF